jgi:hypothetical protein
LNRINGFQIAQKINGKGKQVMEGPLDFECKLVAELNSIETVAKMTEAEKAYIQLLNNFGNCEIKL